MLHDAHKNAPEAERTVIEDALKHLQEWEERGLNASAESLAGALPVRREQAAQVLAEITKAGLATFVGGRYALTAEGREYALQLIRAHRLWETYLARRTSVPETEWHRSAHAIEHQMSARELDELSHSLGHPRFDPHGDPIPKRDGKIQYRDAVGLLDLPEGWEGVLVHIEDEPEAIYSRLVEAGLAAGMQVRIAARTPQGLSLEAEGRTIELSQAEAANLEGAAPSLAEWGPRPSVHRLSDIADGEQVEVDSLTPACRGVNRARLLDLGIVPGSAITPDYASAFGGPRAYRVRGSTIALRREQAEQILVRHPREITAHAS